MIGASAHACSVLRPSWPFLKAMRVKDLSNHLQRAEMGWRCEGRGRSPGAGEEPGVGGAGEDPQVGGAGEEPGVGGVGPAVELGVRYLL